MNEKLQYASMLEIPVNTCNITYKPTRKKRRRKRDVQPELVKEELLKKVNMAQEDEELNDPTNVANSTEKDNYLSAIGVVGEGVDEFGTESQVAIAECGAQLSQSDLPNQLDEQLPQSDYIEDLYQPTSTIRKAKVQKKDKKGRLRISVLGVQLAIIGVLIATIFITNALYTDSGVNVFLRGIFGTESSQVDNRVYTDFTPVINGDFDQDYQLQEGVVTFSGTGSIYPSEKGTVTNVTVDENGKFTVEITHNKNFISVFSGLDYAYSSTGDKVYGTMPVGYVIERASMCFLGGDGELISNYQVINDMVVWSV